MGANVGESVNMQAKANNNTGYNVMEKNQLTD